tara:strand:+ start:240 stop:608 length:369 start_codon:yes stop_codon:yes gene_type:complete
MSNARDLADAGHRLVAFCRILTSSDLGGSGTTMTGTGVSFNISSVTDNGGTAGEYRFYFENHPENANYCAVCSNQGGTSTSGGVYQTEGIDLNGSDDTYVKMYSGKPGSQYDLNNISIVVYF